MKCNIRPANCVAPAVPSPPSACHDDDVDVVKRVLDEEDGRLPPALSLEDCRWFLVRLSIVSFSSAALGRNQRHNERIVMHVYDDGLLDSTTLSCPVLNTSLLSIETNIIYIYI